MSPAVNDQATERATPTIVFKRTGDFQLVEKIRRMAQGESAVVDRPAQTEVADPISIGSPIGRCPSWA